MEKRTISAGFIALICYSILYYSGTPVVIQGAAAALCCFCVYELACATEAIRNEALFTLTILGAFLLSSGTRRRKPGWRGSAWPSPCLSLPC